jgi:hypothetical protein
MWQTGYSALFEKRRKQAGADLLVACGIVKPNFATE